MSTEPTQSTTQEPPISSEYKAFLQGWHTLLPFKGGLSTACVTAACTEADEIELAYLHQLADKEGN